MTSIRLTRDAERDLIDIYLYGIEHYGPKQAEAYAAVLQTSLTRAADNPTFGADYAHVMPKARRYESVSHAVYYRPDGDGILVLRILHGRMDPARHLDMPVSE